MVYCLLMCNQVGLGGCTLYFQSISLNRGSLDLLRAMDSLPERDRACITLRYFEEYSFLKISQILQEPESTVKSRIYRALRKMRQALN